MFFADGNVVHAELGSLVGEEAVYELLSWEDGPFELKMDISTSERTIDVGWSGLLLEGMRRIDEHAVKDRPHCPRCGAFLDRQGRCNNPGCPSFAGHVEAWDETGLEQLLGETVTEHTEVDEMANLQELLKNLADDVPGFISSDVVGMDGLSIAGYSSNPNFDAEAASAQFALVMKLVQKSTGQLKSGDVEDNLVTSNTSYILSRFLGDGHYFLVIAVERDMASLGNVRLMTRNFAPDLWDAIPRRTR